MGLNDAINNGDFGCRKLIRQDRIGAELGRRGYEVDENGEFTGE